MGDHYETLGVARDASKADIKNAFFRLAHRYHPDHHPQADAAARAEAARRFRQAKDAYDLLSDDRRRAEYDRQFRRSSSSSSSGHRQGGSSSSSSGYRQGGSSSSSSSSSGSSSSSSSDHGNRHSGGTSGSSSSSSNGHGNPHGHAGGSRTRPPPPRGGGRSDKFALLVWSALVLLSAIADSREEQSQSEPKEDERIDRVWRMQIAEYRCPPTNTPRAMVSAWDMRNELSKKKWWKNAEWK
ncbi:unnamed protein product [Alopecurus aequalis]